MDTPICDFVRQYADGQPHRLHMPGHKGTGFLGVEHLDITEVEGADVLYAPQGIIQQSQRNAAALFGTAATLYSVEGSTLCIRAMLRLAGLQAAAQGRPARIAAGRNAHRAFLTAAALLDMEVDWLYPSTDSPLLCCPLTAKDLESYFATTAHKPAAVYITSPDYLGNVAPVAELAAVCHRHDTFLLVDNAHGAYLPFLSPSRHPIALGADICCDSAHKTLGVLTGGAYLHLSHRVPEAIRQQATQAMALFASTSPSYLILQSLDAANRHLAEDFPAALAACVEQVAAVKTRLTAAGYTLVGDEPLKITVAAKAYGYTGTALAGLLARRQIVCEFADPDHLVLMVSPYNTDEDLSCLVAALTAIPQQPAILTQPPAIPRPARALSPRQALLSPSRVCSVADSRGCVLAEAAVSCPPAVPILVGGEVIDDAAIQLLHYYGTTHVRVVDPA